MAKMYTSAVGPEVSARLFSFCNRWRGSRFSNTGHRQAARHDATETLFREWIQTRPVN